MLVPIDLQVFIGVTLSNDTHYFDGVMRGLEVTGVQNYLIVIDLACFDGVQGTNDVYEYVKWKATGTKGMLGGSGVLLESPSPGCV